MEEGGNDIYKDPFYPGQTQLMLSLGLTVFLNSPSPAVMLIVSLAVPLLCEGDVSPHSWQKHTVK